MIQAKRLQKSIDGLRTGTYLLLGSAAIVFFIAAISWRNIVYLGDEQVFWGAIGNALATNGVTRVRQTESGTTKQLERVSISFSPTLGAVGYYDTQSANGLSTSESVATKTQDYARYTKLKDTNTTDQKNISGIENIWVNTFDGNNKESKLLGDQLTNGLLVFVANLDHDNRHKFMSDLKENTVYSVSSKARTEVIRGKKVSVYRIVLNVAAYNSALNDYLNILGLPETASQVSQDSNSSQESFEIAIVPGTREIVKAGYPTLDSVSAEEFTSWGVGRDLTLPADYISIQELQKRVNEVQS